MADTKERNDEHMQAISRRRGRPSGHNRLPLGLEQRRARNALYERERREEEKTGFAELGDALACDPSWSKVQILGAAIKYLKTTNKKKAKKTLTVADIQRQNDVLEKQIKMLEETLADS